MRSIQYGSLSAIYPRTWNIIQLILKRRAQIFGVVIEKISLFVKNSPKVLQIRINIEE